MYNKNKTYFLRKARQKSKKVHKQKVICFYFTFKLWIKGDPVQQANRKQC